MSLWSRFLGLGRDSLAISKAFAKELSPILRRQNNAQLTVEDAFRNVMVSQARRQNQVASSFLSLQQQLGLIRYHGFLDYWKSHRPAILQAAGTPGMSSETKPYSTTASNSSGSVAKVAFMITAAMRNELSTELGYTAEQIKSLTPTEASLILHHKLPPADKEARLPALLEAHQAEQERIQQEQARLEEERRLAEETKRKEKAAAAQRLNEEKQGAAEASSEKVLALDSKPAQENVQSTESSQAQQSASHSAQTEPMEGLEADASAGVSAQEPVGSFVGGATEQANAPEKEWYEVVEIRASDNSSQGVALFSTEKEAEMVAELKSGFAERRAKDDLRNKENIPATTYQVQKTLK